ncbi:hypothetical protein EYF80_006516 [Liparis tanakae]|uniref:Uncharacterized protein n=1 Tax=Liparis tanakae TaxID=230148 RepID=A0A4Z2J144_9TELE|nr:hypothetical protein EYF80_006516 [Liparis tanakae]
MGNSLETIPSVRLAQWDMEDEEDEEDSTHEYVAGTGVVLEGHDLLETQLLTASIEAIRAVNAPRNESGDIHHTEAALWDRLPGVSRIALRLTEKDFRLAISTGHQLLVISAAIIFGAVPDRPKRYQKVLHGLKMMNGRAAPPTVGALLRHDYRDNENVLLRQDLPFVPTPVAANTEVFMDRIRRITLVTAALSCNKENDGGYSLILGMWRNDQTHGFEDNGKEDACCPDDAAHWMWLPTTLKPTQLEDTLSSCLGTYILHYPEEQDDLEYPRFLQSSPESFTGVMYDLIATDRQYALDKMHPPVQGANTSAGCWGQQQEGGPGAVHSASCANLFLKTNSTLQFYNLCSLIVHLNERARAEWREMKRTRVKAFIAAVVYLRCSCMEHLNTGAKVTGLDSVDQWDGFRTEIPTSTAHCFSILSRILTKGSLRRRAARGSPSSNGYHVNKCYIA